MNIFDFNILKGIAQQLSDYGAIILYFKHDKRKN